MRIPIYRGDILLAVLPTLPNSDVICGPHPVVVVSNNVQNRNSGVLNVVPITSQRKRRLPCHVCIAGFGLHRPSVILAEQITSLDRRYVVRKLGTLASSPKMEEVERCLKKQLDVA